MTVHVLIADDHDLVRSGFALLVQATPDFQVVGQAGNGVETLRLVAELNPDIVLLDWSMPDTEPIAVIREISRQSPHTRLLVLTAHRDAVLLEQALRSGVTGYIPKDAKAKDLEEAIRAALRGQVYVHPSMVGALAECVARAAPEQPVASEELSEREREVLRYVALGYTSQQIAEALLISTRTVERHRSSLTTKLGLRSRAALVQYARDHQMIN